MTSAITSTWEKTAFEHQFKRFFKKLDLSPSSTIFIGASFRPHMELRMANNTMIGTNSIILVSCLEMAEGSQINAGTIITGRKTVKLGKNSVIGYDAKLFTSSDGTTGAFMNDASPEQLRAIEHGSIIIEDNVFIGSNSIIMPGVKISKGICVRAQSYIDKNLDREFSIYGENGKYFGSRPVSESSEGN
jgi:carbonic anhydrase/acetyltransferase-like protein (isoleucine patch superfamily)